MKSRKFKGQLQLLWDTDLTI